MEKVEGVVVGCVAVVKHIYVAGSSILARGVVSCYLFVGSVGDLVGDLLVDLVGDLGSLLLGTLLGTQELLVGLLDDGADVLDNVASELVGLLLVRVLLGKDNGLDVGGHLVEDLGELVRELLGLVAEGVELLEEGVRELSRVGDDGGSAGAKLVVDGGSPGDGLLDDGSGLLDNRSDALDEASVCCHKGRSEGCWRVADSERGLWRVECHREPSFCAITASSHCSHSTGE